MAVPSLNFSNGSGLQQSYHHQPPAPLFPYNLSLPQPLFNSNPWVAQCLPPVQYYQQPQYMNTASCRQLPMRGRGKNWHRQVIIFYTSGLLLGLYKVLWCRKVLSVGQYFDKIWATLAQSILKIGSSGTVVISCMLQLLMKITTGTVYITVLIITVNLY